MRFGQQSVDIFVFLFSFAFYGSECHKEQTRNSFSACVHVYLLMLSYFLAWNLTRTGKPGGLSSILQSALSFESDAGYDVFFFILRLGSGKMSSFYEFQGCESVRKYFTVTEETIV